MIMEIDLRETYSVEVYLNARIVAEYEALGIQKLLEQMKDIPVGINEKNSRTYLMDGCHRSRALYNLEQFKVIARDSHHPCPFTDDLLVSQVRVLSEEDYFKEHEREYGYVPSSFVMKQ